MSLDPSPLSPRPTPLLNPTDPVPGRGSALIGGFVAIALAVIVMFVSTRFGTQLLFFPQGLNARARAAINQLPQIQGFSDYWTRSYDVNGFTGYKNDSANQHILNDEATTYHMNLVVITLTANVVTQTGTDVIFDPRNESDIDTYQDAVYSHLVQAARAAGLVPVFRLDVRVVQDPQLNYLSTPIGQQWANSLSAGDEQAWFNSYTRFAVHYAQLAQSLNIPLFIIGGDLAYIATDTPGTGATARPHAGLGGDAGVKCYGRRDCEWRHVINAVRSASFTPLGGRRAITGGGYTGKLTFAATVITSTNGAALPTPEWSTITFWDDLDLIGIDAFFPLTIGAQEPTVEDLQGAWNGNIALDAASPAEIVNGKPLDIVKALQDFSDKYGKRILFTGAGYESLAGATGAPGSWTTSNPIQDNQEQQNDMQALIQTFDNETWWLGVIWSSDYPVWPRSSLANTRSANNAGLTEPNYQTNTEWAGKGGGTALSQMYHTVPLPATLWESL
jgi:hypothetical protein